MPAGPSRVASMRVANCMPRTRRSQTEIGSDRKRRLVANGLNRSQTALNDRKRSQTAHCGRAHFVYHRKQRLGKTAQPSESGTGGIMREDSSAKRSPATVRDGPRYGSPRRAERAAPCEESLGLPGGPAPARWALRRGRSRSGSVLRRGASERATFRRRLVLQEPQT